MIWTFLTAFASATVGGVIGAAAIVLVYRGERKARRVEIFDATVADLMREMSAYASALRELEKQGVSRVAGRWLVNSRLVSALAVAQISATAEEYEVLQQLASAIAFAPIATESPTVEASNIEAWVSELMIWRRQIITSAKAMADFKAAAALFLEKLGVNLQTR
jgi:hypothetical protein